MQPEKVFSMCSEKSANINDIPGGGTPDFTTTDASHALAHMENEEFNYCQYVFLLYGRKALDSLTRNIVFHIVSENPDIDYNKNPIIFMAVCRMACMEQTMPAGKITNKSRYNKLGITRNDWRYNWEYIFRLATIYLNVLRCNVEHHIIKATSDS